MAYNIVPAKVLRFLLAIITCLILLNCMGIISKYFFDRDVVMGLVPLFDVHTEQNIPSFYSAVALLLASVLLVFVAFVWRSRDGAYVAWLILGLIFLFLAVDEFASLHENLMRPTRNLLDLPGFLYFAWVIPYGIALLLFVALYLKFLLRLPRRTATLFVVSGTIFVMGAIVIESVSAQEFTTGGHTIHSLPYAILYTIEETLEMVGIALFIFSILDYMTREFGPLQITFASSQNTR